MGVNFRNRKPNYHFLLKFYLKFQIKLKRKKMLKAGLLPAPVIQPLRYDTIGTKIKVGPNTYIQIKSGI